MDYEIIDETPSACPDISIAMLAYNHENYIVQALDGVLMQKTDYKFKVILAEDNSTDKTRAIVIGYQKRFPDKIKLILQNKNVGANTNNMDLLSQLEGKYVAALEGDDYWTDPLKLQKQVDFLELNPGCALCGHRSLMKFEDVNTPDRIEGLNVKATGIIPAEVIIRGDININTVTMVFRSNVIRPIPQMLSEAPFGDAALQLLCASYGDIAYFIDVMSVYRRGVPGAWSESERSGKAIEKKRWAENRINSFKKCFELFNEHTDFKYEVLLTERLERLKVASLLSMQDYSKKLDVIKAIFKNRQSFLQFKSGNEINTLIRLIFGLTIYNKLSKLRNKTLS